MKLPEPLKTQLTKNLVTALVALFAFFGAKVYHDVSAPFLAHVLPAISNATLLSACSLLLLLVILLVWWVIYLHRVNRESQDAKDKAFDDQFLEFLPRLGVWTHKTKSGYFCPNCKARHCESPMRERPDGWKCLIRECGYVAPNPDYQRPEPPLPRRSPGSWLVR